MEQDFNEQNTPREETDDSMEVQPSADTSGEFEEVLPPPVSDLGTYPADEPDESVSATYASDSKLAELERDINQAVEESSSDSDNADENYSVEEPTPATSLTRDQIVEAVLFSSDGPLPSAKIASVIGAISSKEIREIIDRLNSNYCQWNCSFRIQEIAGGFQMMTCPEYATYLQQLYKVRSESKLSGAALETLAVIAYKQPVLRAEIEAIRGVACGEMIRTLMEKDLIKIVGRAEELGRPMLYGTTKRFLQVFGLGSLEDLPKVPELLPPTRSSVVKTETSQETSVVAVEADQPSAQTAVESNQPSISEDDASQASPIPAEQDVEGVVGSESTEDLRSESVSESKSEPKLELESSPQAESSDLAADELDEDDDLKVE